MKNNITPKQIRDLLISDYGWDKGAIIESRSTFMLIEDIFKIINTKKTLTTNKK